MIDDSTKEINEIFVQAYHALTALNVAMVGICGALVFKLPEISVLPPHIKTLLTIWFFSDGILALIVQYLHTLSLREWAHGYFFRELGNRHTEKGNVFNLPAAAAKKHHDNAQSAHTKASKSLARQRSLIGAFEKLANFGFISFVVGLLVFGGYWIALLR